MNSTEQQKFEEKFREAKQKYISNLPNRISEIKSIWKQLQEEWRDGLLLKMQNLCHNLAGSGGTFDCPQLSDNAKHIENALEALKNLNGGAPASTELQTISDLLIQLQETELATIRGNEAAPALLTRADTIFILDEDLNASISMSRQLMYYGCTVKIVSDINSLEKTLHTTRALVILIDLDFAFKPFGNSTALETIRDTWKIDCPIIFVSNHDDFESRMKAIKANGSAYFTKPMDIALLIERINILSNTNIIEPYRVLIIEDDIELAHYYALILERGGIRTTVESKPEEALADILRLNPELVVLDLYMPNYNGIEIVKLLRQHQSLYSLPIVLLTGERDINTQYLAREVGVDDFLIKPIEATHLFEAVLNRVQRARYMNLSISKDSLTGLFVHKKINEYLKMQLSMCSRYSRTLAYAILDIDDFKKVNDSYGHLIGDSVLIVLSNLLKNSVRTTDFVGRYGGEEFVIIFPETNLNNAVACIERIRTKFAEIEHYANDITFKVTFSAGVSSYPGYTDMDTIMAMADKALYESKNKGKNQTSTAK
jgi:diguanylate cyclase (GGDEF)-like protein